MFFSEQFHEIYLSSIQQVPFSSIFNDSLLALKQNEKNKTC